MFGFLSVVSGNPWFKQRTKSDHRSAVFYFVLRIFWHGCCRRLPLRFVSLNPLLSMVRVYL
jgi:hypothetical protein